MFVCLPVWLKECVLLTVFVCVLRRDGTQEDEEFICALVAIFRDSTQELQFCLQSGAVSKHQADAHRARHRALTAKVLEFLIARQQRERSPSFSRSAILSQLRKRLESPEDVLALNELNSRLQNSAEALLGELKEEEASPPTCASQALRPVAAGRTTEICFTARAVKRPRLTPHPRAGPDAVAAAGGAVEALLAEEESTLSESEEGVFSSTDEEGQEHDSDTD